MIFARSLGGVVISNYIWNQQRKTGDVQPRSKKTDEDAPQSAAGKPLASRSRRRHFNVRRR